MSDMRSMLLQTNVARATGLDLAFYWLCTNVPHRDTSNYEHLCVAFDQKRYLRELELRAVEISCTKDGKLLLLDKILKDLDADTSLEWAETLRDLRQLFRDLARSKYQMLRYDWKPAVPDRVYDCEY